MSKELEQSSVTMPRMAWRDLASTPNLPPLTVQKCIWKENRQSSDSRKGFKCSFRDSFEKSPFSSPPTLHCPQADWCSPLFL